MNRIFSFKALFLLPFLYLQSLNLQVSPEDLKVFPEQKGNYLICPNGNTLTTDHIPYLPWGRFTKEQQPNYWYSPNQWDSKLFAEDAFNSEIIVYDGSLSKKTKLRLMPSFLDNTNIPTSYKSTNIIHSSESANGEFINYFFENSKGNKLTLKQRLYRDISYFLITDDGAETIVYREGFIAYENEILATLHCNKNNTLIFKDIQEITLPSSTDEYGEKINTNKTIFWIRELRFKTTKHQSQKSTIEL